MQKMYHIGMNRTFSRDRLTEQDQTHFVNLAKEVLSRDGHRCQLCEFKATNWQQVVTVNERYTLSDFTLDNMITVCPICFLGLRMGYSAEENNITFVYLPELTQGELNNLMRLIYFYLELPEVSVEENELTPEQQSLNDCKSYVEALLMELRDRREVVNQNVYHYCKINNLKMLVSMFSQMPDDKYQKRALFLGPIRYLADPSVMAKFNAHYKDTVFRNLNGHRELLESAKLKLKELLR